MLHILLITQAGCRRSFPRYLLHSMTRLAFWITWLITFRSICPQVLAAEQAPGPNIVVILADDLGYGDPACNNPQSKIATPHIDQLSREGIRFTDAHAPASWCTPTRYGLLTGRYPFRTSLAWNRQPVIEEGRLTLPAMLGQCGYRTVMVGKWHLGFQREDHASVHHGGPIDRGFTTWFGIPASLDIPPYYFIEGDRPVAPPSETIGDRNSPGWTPIQGEFWRGGGIAPGFKHAEVLPILTERAEREIRDHGRQHREKPLFLYLALPAPHTPWLPTPEFAGRSPVPLYGDFVMQVDATIGRVVQALDAAGLADDTLLVVTSDNGPVWYEADVERSAHRSAGIYRGMKGDAWEAGHRMPLVMRWPGHIAAGRVSGQLACLTDIFATCAAIVDFDVPRDAGEDSFDLSPILLGAATAVAERETLIVNSTRDFLTVRRGPWKLLPFRGSGGFIKRPSVGEDPTAGPPGQLYNVVDDPTESKNLYEQHPEIVAELTALLERARRDGRTR